jgi:hypothetical protein
MTLCCVQSRQQASQACMPSPQLPQQQGWATGLALTVSPVLPACAVQLVTAAGRQLHTELCVVRLAAACQQRPAGCLRWVLQCCWGSLQMLLSAVRRCQQQGACCWSGRCADLTTVGWHDVCTSSRRALASWRVTLRKCELCCYEVFTHTE